MITLNQIVAAFKQIADKHSQIHSFKSVEDLQDFSIENSDFPVLLLYLDEVDILENHFSFNLQMLILTKPEKDNSNAMNIYSDTILIANDVLNILEGGHKFNIVKNQITPQRLNTDANIIFGVTTNITINVLRDTCEKAAPTNCN